MRPRNRVSCSRAYTSACLHLSVCVCEANGSNVDQVVST